MTEKEWRALSDKIEAQMESKLVEIVKDENTWTEENRERFIAHEIDVLFQDEKIDAVMRDISIDVVAYKVTRNEKKRVLLLPPVFSLADFYDVVNNIGVTPEPE